MLAMAQPVESVTHIVSADLLRKPLDQGDRLGFVALVVMARTEQTITSNVGRRAEHLQSQRAFTLPTPMLGEASVCSFTNLLTPRYIPTTP